ncbi:DNA-deoxyinosine glycosylase [Tepidibacter mesophilus]|uniref:DNA-deoxyinosine glycosylase n=1 Tax=Tepidibacter mesophilus TaxID=655607 RepID=UPI001650F4A1|nr:DNA-deoxyinosine glycosylase [Tepidibacter mesophilus]
MSNIKSFSPIIDSKSTILILGSIPGKESLRQNQYYAYNQNQFWKIIYSLFDTPIDDDYNKKILFLKKNNIALWDVIKSCYREGSLDSNIKMEEANNFESLFNRYPNIEYVFFNGLKAYNVFKKKVGLNFENIKFQRLESTSPANTKRFEYKLDNWSIIKNIIKR